MVASWDEGCEDERTLLPLCDEAGEEGDLYRCREVVPREALLAQRGGGPLGPINVYRQKSIDTARDWIRNVKGKLAVLEKESGKLIGMGGITPWTWEGEELFDITYRLRESAWGKGYGWELAEALVNHGFRELGLEQLTATITPDNLPSRKIAEKLGMRFDRHILLLGVPTDLYRLRRT